MSEQSGYVRNRPDSPAPARRIWLDRRELVSPRLPESFDGVRLVFVADVHAGPFLREKQMTRLVRVVNSLEPDILVLGGDYVGGRAHGARFFYPAATGFEASLAKLAVLGNHDVWEGAEEARTGLAAAGFVVLENSSFAVERDGGRIVVAGLEDVYTGHPDAVRAADGVDPDGFAVLVTHNPDALAEALPATAEYWDLALAGHTHGGQITAFGRFAFLVPSRYGHRYRRGWLEEEGVPVLVSNGVGTVTLPMRFYAPPEIHVVTLRRSPRGGDTSAGG